MQHDEIRLAGTCGLCEKSDSAGTLLADQVATCLKTIRGIDSEAQILVWSDMFDPFHNARANYYLVRGDLAGSWAGLDPAVRIVNWNGGKKNAITEFFRRTRASTNYCRLLRRRSRWARCELEGCDQKT